MATRSHLALPATRPMQEHYQHVTTADRNGPADEALAVQALGTRQLPLVLHRVLLDTGEAVTLRTWTFAISFIQSSTPVAQALICPDARYVAVRWQDGRLDRRHVSSLLWLALGQELTRDLATERTPGRA